jgi:hypothetical protein
MNIFYRSPIWYWYRLVFCGNLNNNNAYFYDDFWYILNNTKNIKNLSEKWKNYINLITLEL